MANADHSHWGREGLIWLPGYSPSSRDVEAGTGRQELKQRPWRNDAYWLASHDLLSLHFCRTHDRLALPHQSHTHKMPYRLVYSQIYEGIISIWVPLFSLSCLWQVDLKLASTIGEMNSMSVILS